ncbi:MAG: Gldg family protein [Sphingobium sp.]|nr:Gldg family protein [Sphingobium sp.]
MRAIRLFLMLSLPLLAFLLGLARMLRTGQVDPLLWAAPCAILLIVAALLPSTARPSFRTLWSALGCLLVVGLFVLLEGRPFPLGRLALSATVVMAAAAAALCLRHRRPRLPGIVLIGGMMLVLWLAGRGDRLAPAADREPLAVVTALPLFWAEGASGLGDPHDAPIIAVLRTRFDVRPLDAPDPASLAAFRTLLLAQPRALSPAALVEIDDWVRAGGRAVILADPLLRWPSPLPPGDRRRPPATGLLDPLLAHWGVMLERPAGAAVAEERRLLTDARLVTLAGSSHFRSATDKCRRRRDAPVAACAIGGGKVVLVADADLLDDRLWLHDPARPLDQRAWTADNPALLLDWLGRPTSDRRPWVSDRAGLIAAIRWAMLLGLAWAMVGTMLFIRAKRWLFAPFSPASPSPSRPKWDNFPS